MIPIRFLFAALIAGAASLATAQTKPAAPAASQPSDCGKPRHDHAAEKGMPGPKSADCKAAPSSSTSTKQKNHDHGKVHKQQ